jgi:hypothetical protein
MYKDESREIVGIVVKDKKIGAKCSKASYWKNFIFGMN